MVGWTDCFWMKGVVKAPNAIAQIAPKPPMAHNVALALLAKFDAIKKRFIDGDYSTRPLSSLSRIRFMGRDNRK